MSRSGEEPAQHRTAGAAPSIIERLRAFAWRPFMAGIALVLLTIFAVENTTRVKVHWLFFTSDNALIAVIVVSAILGALVGQILGLLRRRRQQSPQ